MGDQVHLIVFLLLAAILIYGIVRSVNSHRKREIARSLTLAKRGLISLRSVAADGGRKGRTIERAAWVQNFGPVFGAGININIGSPDVPKFLARVSEKDLQDSVYAEKLVPRIIDPRNMV